VSSFKKAERRDLNVKLLGELLAKGCTRLQAELAALAASYGEAGCWRSAKKIVELLGRRARQGKLHHPKSLPRALRTMPEGIVSRTRVRPFGKLPSGQRSRQGASHVRFTPYVRAAERRRWREAQKKAPGLVEHEERRRELDETDPEYWRQLLRAASARPPPR
jgi:hypothetical protein